MAKKLTDLTILTEIAETDITSIVDISDTTQAATGTTKKTTMVTSFLSTGWIPANGTWTYASATTITVPNGAAGKYQKGDKIRLKQGGAYKYYYIITVADTLLTVTGGIDYTVANAAITDNCYSHIENPLGFPDWFNWTPTWSAGGSMTVASVVLSFALFSIKGGLLFYKTMAVMTTGGTAHSDIYFTTVLNRKTIYTWESVGYGYAYDGADNQTWSRWNGNDANRICVRKYNSANYALTAGVMVHSHGFYAI